MVYVCNNRNVPDLHIILYFKLLAAPVFGRAKVVNFISITNCIAVEYKSEKKRRNSNFLYSDVNFLLIEVKADKPTK